ncbi:hypothetical protein [Flindersiella endophytica]
MPAVYVSDPIVPVELRLLTGRRYTLYQPGWFGADDDTTPFLGDRSDVFGFGTLQELQAFVGSGAAHSLTGSRHYSALRSWRLRDYSDKLCSYDLCDPPELADGKLDSSEDRSLGSTLALMLDLLDHTGVDDEHAQALRDDREISRLAGGDSVGGVFRADQRRKQVVELLDQHWAWCVGQVSSRFTEPESIPPLAAELADVGADDADLADGSDLDDLGEVGDDYDDDHPPLDEVSDLVTTWWGFEDVGFYSLRTTVLDDGLPLYPGRPGNDNRMLVWLDLDDLVGRVRTGAVAGLPADSLPGDTDFDPRPHDEFIVDLHGISASLTTTMDSDQAATMLGAWIELVRLAEWGDWLDVAELLDVGSPIGAFSVGCLTDLARSAPGSDRALETADLESVRTDWVALLDVLRARMQVAPVAG